MNKEAWWFAPIGIVVMLLIVAVLIGCATLTPEQSADRRIVDTQNWENCHALLKYQNIAWTSRHRHVRFRRHSSWEIRSDLRDALCKIRLQQYWIRYET